MPVYQYRAIGPTGDILEGEVNAASRSEAMEKVQGLGHLPLRAEEAERGASRGWLSRDIFAQRVSRAQLGLMTRELAMLLRAGISLDRALEILVSLAGRSRLRAVLAAVREEVRNGAALAEAMAAQGTAFPPYYVSMIRAGETGGTLDEVLERLAGLIEASSALRGQVAAALLYPAVLVFMAGVSLVVLFTVVIPQFEPLFRDAGEALPWITRAVVAAGHLLVRSWWVLTIAALVLVLVAYHQLSDPDRRRRWDRQVLRLPVVGAAVTKIEVARFARLLGTLLTNGVPLPNAMSLVRETLSNRALAAAVEAAAGRVKQGQGVARPLMEAGVFPSLAVDLVRIGEETSQLDEMLVRVAEIYERDARRTLERLVALLVPALTIGLGALIALIIGSVLFAVLSVNKLAL